MRQAVVTGLLLMLLLFVPPLLFAGPGETGGTESAPPSSAPEETVPSSPLLDSGTVLRVWNGTSVEEMTLAEYLPGVVRGEMPATFEPQALAAQAVAERTYIYYHLQGGPKDAHPDADICTDPGCCSAWTSEDKAREKWGDKFDEYEAKIRQAVTDTDGQVLLYDGAPILAAFHSSSAGTTASSGDVWSSDLPYLRSVASPENGDTVPNYYSVVTVPAEEFRDTFLSAHPEAKLEGDAAGWITDVTENGSGRVESASVGGVTVRGTELRSLYKLRSACFTVSAGEDGVTFRVTGYGHGVGMSQYGANQLAREGKTWQEIVAWYYTGVTIGTMPG